jgi:hypothetical protein
MQTGTTHSVGVPINNTDDLDTPSGWNVRLNRLASQAISLICLEFPDFQKPIDANWEFE